MTGDFTFDGGSNTDTVIADLDTDWTLDVDKLIAANNESMRLTNVENANLFGGDSGNLIEVLGWNASVAIDGRNASDQFKIHQPYIYNVVVNDSGGRADQLTVLGDDGDNLISVHEYTVAASTIEYDGIETLRIAGLAGDDDIQINDSSADLVIIDNGTGSDTYDIAAGTTDAFVKIHDSGPVPEVNGDVDLLSGPDGVVMPLNVPFNVGTMTVLYDETIEQFNAPPTIAVDHNSVTVNEGQLASMTGTYTNPGDGATFHASIGSAAAGAGNTWTWSYAATDGPDEIQTVTLTIVSGSGLHDSVSFDLFVDNVAPTVSLFGPTTVEEGETANYTFSVNDPGTDTFSLLDVNAGSGGTVSNVVFDVSSGVGSFEVAYPNGPASTGLTVQVADSDGAASNVASANVSILNVDPMVELTGPASVDEGSSVTFLGDFTDPGSDTHVVEWDFGDGITASGTLTPTHVYADNGTYTVTLTVTDDDGASGSQSIDILVNSVNPTVVAGGDRTVEEGINVNLIATFNDLGTLDSHVARVDWGDGTPVDDGIVSESPFGPPGSTSGANGTVTGSHVYADNGKLYRYRHCH